MEKLSTTELEHVAPEEVGINSATVSALIREFNEKKIAVHSFTFIRHGKIFAQGFYKPFSKETPHVLFSMSKAFTSTAVGFAVNEGLLNLDCKISKFFPEKKSGKKLFNQLITVRTLLTMSSDKLITFLDNKENGDWVDKYLKAPYYSKPNTKFNYISENTFMLSAIVKKVTGQSVVDYLYPRVFEPLGIEKPFWETDGEGNNAGGWGLYMKNEDLAKFFTLFIHDGKWLDGTQILPAEWVREATKKQIDSFPSGHEEYMSGYGFQFWRNSRPDSFRAYGLFGQLAFMFPKEDAVLMLNCGHARDYEISDIMYRYFPSAFYDEPLLKNENGAKQLLDLTNSLAVEKLMPTPRNKELEKFLDFKIIRTKTNKFCSVINGTITQMLFNRPGKINTLRFSFDDLGCDFYFREKNEENEIRLGMDGEWAEDSFTLGGITYKAESMASWQADGSLTIWIRPIETTHTRIFNVKIKPHGVKVKNTSTPSYYDLVMFYLMFLGHPVNGPHLQKIIHFLIQDVLCLIIEQNFSGKFIG